MPRRPSPNPPGPGDQIRISFLLDRRREPELAYIFDLEGHGDRPRELLRLAQLGYRAEMQMREFQDQFYQAQLANLKNAMPGAPGDGEGQSPVAAAVRAPEPTRAAAEVSPAPKRKETPEPNKPEASEPKEVNPAPAASQSDDTQKADAQENSGNPSGQKINGLNGFLA